MFEVFSHDDQGFENLKSYSGKSELAFVRDDNHIGIRLRSPMGNLEIGIGDEMAPFISISRSENHFPIHITVDKLSGQPVLTIKAADAEKIIQVPVDKIIPLLLRFMK